MRQRINTLSVQNVLALVILAAAVLTGVSFLARHDSKWLLGLIGLGLLVYLFAAIMRREKILSILKTLGVLLVVLQIFLPQGQETLGSIFAFMGINIQILLFLGLLFPMAYFWSGSTPEIMPADGSSKDDTWLILTFVIVGCALCVGVGFLVTQHTGWIWLMLGLWALVFPKGLIEHKFSPLAGLFGLIGIALVIGAVLTGWVPQDAMFTASGFTFGIMLLITVVALFTSRSTLGRSLLR